MMVDPLTSHAISRIMEQRSVAKIVVLINFKGGPVQNY